MSVLCADVVVWVWTLVPSATTAFTLLGDPQHAVVADYWLQLIFSAVLAGIPEKCLLVVRCFYVFLWFPDFVI